MDLRDDPAMRTSHEAICRTRLIQARGAPEVGLHGHLRRRRSVRYQRPFAPVLPRVSRIQRLVSIAARTAEGSDSAVPGRWRGDLLAGAKDSYIGTVGERQLRSRSM